MRMTKKTVAAYGALGCAGVFAAYYLRHAAPILEHIEKHGVIGFVMGALALAIVAGIAAAWATSVGATNLKQAISAGLAVPAIVFAAGIDGGGKPPPDTKTAGFSLVAAAGDDGGAFLDSLRLFFAPVESRVRAERERSDRIVLESKIATQEARAALSTANGELELARHQRDVSVQDLARERASIAEVESKFESTVQAAKDLDRTYATMKARMPTLLPDRVELEGTLMRLQTNLAAASSVLRSRGPANAPQDVEVPEVRRLSLADAYVALRERGLVVGLATDFFARPVDWRQVHVNGQRPEPGGRTARGSVISVEVR